MPRDKTADDRQSNDFVKEWASGKLVSVITNLGSKFSDTLFTDVITIIQIAIAIGVAIIVVRHSVFKKSFEVFKRETAGD